MKRVFHPVALLAALLLSLPGTLSCAWCAEVDTDPVAFEPDSHLLILRGKLHRDGTSGEHYYILENGSFVHLRTVVFD